MYSFQYDKKETWAAWPNDVRLSEFSDGNGDIVISLIVKQLMDGVRDQMDKLKEAIQNEKALLTTTMDTLLATFEDYQAESKINEAFVRCDMRKSIVHPIFTRDVCLQT